MTLTGPSWKVVLSLVSISAFQPRSLSVIHVRHSQLKLQSGYIEFLLLVTSDLDGTCF